jgi:hypothetical protein
MLRPTFAGELNLAVSDERELTTKQVHHSFYRLAAV